MFSDHPDGRNYHHKTMLDSNQNFNEVRDFDFGEPLKTIARPVPLLENARSIHIDWLNPIRATYFPLAYQAEPGYEDHCVYSTIEFRLRQGVGK